MKLGSYLSKHGYVLRKDTLERAEYTSLVQELRGRPLVDEKYNRYNQDSSFPLYTETKNKLYIPKMYGLEKFGFPESETENYIGCDWSNDIEFTGSLYDRQIGPCNVLIEQLKNGSGGILSLGTGFGKSICALYVLSKLRKKTIIVVNKVTLMNQWASEIKRFLPNASVGFIQGQSNVDIHDKDIVIAMLQSLARIDYPIELFQEFGVTLIDEIHNTSSRVFSKVLSKLASKFTVGLSATPKRSDGCEYVFKWFIGDIVFQTSNERSGLPPIVNMVTLSSKEYKEVATENRVTGQKQIQFSTMLSDLTCMSNRNLLIVELIKKMVCDGRKVLILSDRREHLKLIKGLLDKDTCVAFTYGLFIGQMKMTELERSKGCNVILASYQAFGEGVSERDLDTLILITPKKFIGHLKNATKNESGKLEQIVGRIFRKDHTERNPLIIDLCDDFSVYRNQSKQRRVFYKQHFQEVTIEEQSFDLDNATIDIKNLLSKSKRLIKNIDERQEENTNSIMNYCLLDE